MIKRYWSHITSSAKAMAEKSRQRDRGLECHVEKLSRFLWPWRESWFLVVVGFLCILDYTSTYFALELRGNIHTYESGPLAIWALETGGFAFLLLIDIIAVVTLSFVAIALRHLYLRSGFEGYGRAAFVIFLSPYVVITIIAILIIYLIRFASLPNLPSLLLSCNPLTTF